MVLAGVLAELNLIQSADSMELFLFGFPQNPILDALNWIHQLIGAKRNLVEVEVKIFQFDFFRILVKLLKFFDCILTRGHFSFPFYSPKIQLVPFSSISRIFYGLSLF